MTPPEATVGVLLAPRATRDAVGPLIDGVVRVRVTRPAQDGEANRALIRVLAGALDLPPSDLAIVAGPRSRHKRVRIAGLDLAAVAERLARSDR
jgi:uncharacterized protein (TIGR00251 family)